MKKTILRDLKEKKTSFLMQRGTILQQKTHCVNFAVVRLSASRCIWANRRPGNVRNAPIREQSRARISLKVSLDMGPL